MFDEKKSIIFISRTKIQVSRVALSNPPKRQQIAEFDWTPETFAQVFPSVIKASGSNVRLLLSEDFAYVVHVTISADLPNERDLVKKIAQEIIPEPLDNTVWDFKEMLIVQDKTLEKKIIQVVAIVSSFLEQLNVATQHIRLNIEAVEPTSYALARLTQNETTPVLIVHRQNEMYHLVLAERELVVSTKTIHTDPTIDIVNTFLAFANDQFHITPTKIILSGEAIPLDVTQLQTAERTVENRLLDPQISLAEKIDLKGKDEKILTFDLSKMKTMVPTNSADQVKPPEGNGPTSTTPPPVVTESTSNTKVLLLICIPVFLLCIGVIANANRSQIEKLFSQSQTHSPVVTPTTQVATASPTLVPTTTASSSANVDTSQYPLVILNGSGITGEASKLAETLKAQGFTIERTANADKEDYEITQLQTKKNIDTSFKTYLDEQLKKLYGTIENTVLTATAEEDIIIIIGQKQ